MWEIQHRPPLKTFNSVRLSPVPRYAQAGNFTDAVATLVSLGIVSGHTYKLSLPSKMSLTTSPGTTWALRGGFSRVLVAFAEFLVRGSCSYKPVTAIKRPRKG